MVDIESVMARLYEDEGLTTDLDDSEAQQLLKWAEAQVTQMAQTQTDDAVFDEIFGVLRQFVKRVNRVVGQRAELAPEELTEQLSKLADNARALNAGEMPAQALDASAQSLNYREWPPGNPVPTNAETDPIRPRRLTSGRLAEILNVPAGRKLTLITGMTGFEISYPPGGSDLLMVQPVSLKVTLQRKGNTGHVLPETFTYRRTFFLPEQR